MKVDYRLIIIILALVGVVLVLYLYSSDLVGKVIDWTTLEEDDPFSAGFPDLSPETLPNNNTLNTVGAIDAECNTAKEVYDEKCEEYQSKYKKGCRWWHFSLFSDCKEIKQICYDARDSAQAICAN